jgi:hypothetical protein
MATRLNVDTIPQLARPNPVEGAISEATDLRARLRAAQEEVASLQADLERLEADDVADAARRLRDGVQPGSIPPAISKAKHAVEPASRNARALALASEAALTISTRSCARTPGSAAGFATGSPRRTSARRSSGR